MDEPLVIQGRRIGGEELAEIRGILRAHPDWSRYRLSRALAHRWDWRNGKGTLKDIACRELMRKLAARNLIELPPPRMASPNRHRHAAVVDVPHDQTPIEAPLAQLRPLRLRPLGAAGEAALFACLLARHHYLSFRQPVGENVSYLLADREDRPVACALFGAAAWRCAARDRFVGWDDTRRRDGLPLIAANHRFLVLPWVRSSCLASHILGLLTRRLSADWEAKYGHPVVLAETFVECSRFRGTCYQAANWTWLGQTAGRGRQDRYGACAAGVKDVYVRALRSDALRRLRG